MGFGASIGNLSWQQPMMNNFSYNWNTPSWDNSAWTTSSSTSSKKETADEYEARIKKENSEKFEKLKTLYAQKQEANKALQQIQEQKTTLDGTVKEDGSVEIKGSIQEDGTIKEEKLENMSTGAKIMRGGMNLLQGIGNACKKIVGFDPKTGKWDPVKCAINVAIAVGIGAICYFAGPLGAVAAAKLGGSTIAAGVGTAIANIPTALSTIGVITGTYIAGKGIKDTCDAIKNNNLENFDNGTQDIGAGALIGISSAMGLRNISKSAALPTSSTSNIEVGSNAMNTLPKSNFFKDITINPWKVGAANFKEASTIMANSDGGTKGFLAACKNTWRKPLTKAKNEFHDTAQRVHSNIAQEAEQLQLKIAKAETRQERVLLEMQLEKLNASCQNFAQNANKKTGWYKLTNGFKDANKALKEAKKIIKEKGSVEIRGEKFTIEDISKLDAQIKVLSSQQKSLTKAFNTIKPSTFKLAMQSALRGSGDDAATANNFGFSTKWYAQPWNWLQSKYYGFVKPTNAFGWGMKALSTSFYVAEPYWLAQGVVGSSAAAPLNTMFVYDPLRTKEQGGTTVISAEQYAQAKSGYEAQEKQIKDALGSIDSQLKSLSA